MIDGERVRLRAPLATDIGFLASLRSDEGLQRLLASRARGSSPEQTRAWLDRLQSDPSSLFWVIALLDGDTPAGYLQITGIDTVSRNGMLGICLGREFQGKGLGGEALVIAEAYLRRVWNMHKLGLHVLAGNRPAVGLYRRYGYKDVGVLTDHFFFDGTFEDVLVMEHLL